jgi:hypothetical protein
VYLPDKFSEYYPRDSDPRIEASTIEADVHMDIYPPGRPFVLTLSKAIAEGVNVNKNKKPSRAKASVVTK